MTRKIGILSLNVSMAASSRLQLRCHSYPTYAVKKLLTDQFLAQKTLKPLIRAKNVKTTIAAYDP